MAGKSVARDEGEGQAFWMLGGLYEVKVASDETNGATTVIEFTIPEGAGPPPHTHKQDETISVLEGRVRFQLDGETFEGGPGAVIFMPAGTLETWEPIGGTARTVGTYTPGGIDKFFAEAGEPAKERKVPPPLDAPPDIERLAAIGAKYGLELQAPPG